MAMKMASAEGCKSADKEKGGSPTSFLPRLSPDANNQARGARRFQNFKKLSFLVFHRQSQQIGNGGVIAFTGWKYAIESECRFKIDL
jgi:hypothetical protein